MSNFPSGTIVANSSFKAYGGLVEVEDVTGGERLPGLIFKIPLAGALDNELTIVFGSGDAFQQLQKAMAELNSAAAYRDKVVEIDFDEE